MKCDVIVTYCWNRVGYNIIRSLYERGLKVVVGDTSTYNICSISKFSIGKFIYRDFTKDEQGFIEDLKKAIKKYSPKVLMPTHDETLIIAKHIGELPQDVIYTMDSYEKQIRLSDKYKATLLADSVGVPIPRFIDDIRNAAYPIVVKTRFGNSAKGVFFPKDYEEAKNLLMKLDKRDILIEEFFVGRDYSVDCVRYDDFFQASTYRSLVTKTDGGGTTTQRILVEMPELERYSKLLLDKVDYKGVCGIDFKVNEETKNAVFIEVNARFTGGLATPMAGGFDIPYIVYSFFSSGKYNQKIQLRMGTKTKWILGDIITLVGKILRYSLTMKEFKQIMSWNFDAFDDYRKEDKKAILGEFLYYFIKLVKNKKLNP